MLKNQKPEVNKSIHTWTIESTCVLYLYLSVLYCIVWFAYVYV